MGRDVLQSHVDRRTFLRYGARLLVAPTAIASILNSCAGVSPNFGHPAWSVRAPIYELNPYFFAQYARLSDIVPHLEDIADLGVGILWIMPIYQRSGISMYSVYNYTTVDRELGTLADLKNLVNRAQALDMRVILDFVPNHTANNHPWIQQHPGWYSRDASGNILHPWPDVSQLNWENTDEKLREELWTEMERIVTYWVQNAAVDGFRWDTASRIPEPWYARVRESLQRIKPVFFLAEGDTPRLHPNNDISYDSHFHMVCKNIAWGAAAATLDTHLDRERDAYGSITPLAYRMRYTLNHDLSNSSESEFADFGGQPATLAFEMLSVTVGPRTKPMIYSGQEIGIRTALDDYNRVTTNPDYMSSLLRPFYRRLFTLYRDNPALHPASSFTKFDSDDNQGVYAFGRTDGASGANKIVVIANLSGESRSAKVTVPGRFHGTYTDLDTDGPVSLGPSHTPTLAAWGYQMLTR